MKKQVIVLIITILQATTMAANHLYAQSGWKYVAGKGDIKVYNRSVPDSRIKALKAECILHATVKEVTALLMDVSETAKWMCHAKQCKLLRKVSETELFYYTEVKLPWPLDNRDFVTHAKMSRDPLTGVVTVDAPAVPGILPGYEGRVRISQSRSLWKITEIGAQTVKVEYDLQVDPGGMIPAHVVNAFAVRAPIETFTNMKKILKDRRKQP